MDSRMLRTFFILLFVLNSVFAACTIDSSKIDFSQVTFSLKDDSTADVAMIFGLNYGKECLLSEFVNVDVNSSSSGKVSVGTLDIVSDEVPCPAKFQEIVLKSFPGLSSGVNCYGNYLADKNYLQLSFYGTTTKLSSSVDKNYVFALSPNEFYSRFGKNSSLTIILPSNSDTYGFSPKITNFMTPSIINWAPFPQEKITVNYSPFDYQKETFEKLVPVLALISIIFIFITATSIYFMKSIILSSEKVDAIEKVNQIRDKLKLLEASYLRRQIDETTYRRLNEQYQMQLNETALLSKEKTKTGLFGNLVKFNKNESENTKLQNDKETK
jgi:hypothetical protein